MLTPRTALGELSNKPSQISPKKTARAQLKGEEVQLPPSPLTALAGAMGLIVSDDVQDLLDMDEFETATHGHSEAAAYSTELMSMECLLSEDLQCLSEMSAEVLPALSLQRAAPPSISASVVPVAPSVAPRPTLVQKGIKAPPRRSLTQRLDNTVANPSTPAANNGTTSRTVSQQKKTPKVVGSAAARTATPSFSSLRKTVPPLALHKASLTSDSQTSSALKNLPEPSATKQWLQSAKAPPLALVHWASRLVAEEAEVPHLLSTTPSAAGLPESRLPRYTPRARPESSALDLLPRPSTATPAAAESLIAKHSKTNKGRLSLGNATDAHTPQTPRSHIPRLSFSSTPVVPTYANTPSAAVVATAAAAAAGGGGGADMDTPNIASMSSRSPAPDTTTDLTTPREAACKSHIPRPFATPNPTSATPINQATVDEETVTLEPMPRGASSSQVAATGNENTVVVKDTTTVETVTSVPMSLGASSGRVVSHVADKSNHENILVMPDTTTLSSAIDEKTVTPVPMPRGASSRAAASQMADTGNNENTFILEDTAFLSSAVGGKGRGSAVVSMGLLAAEKEMCWLAGVGLVLETAEEEVCAFSFLSLFLSRFLSLALSCFLSLSLACALFLSLFLSRARVLSHPLSLARSLSLCIEPLALEQQMRRSTGVGLVQETAEEEVGAFPPRVMSSIQMEDAET